MSSSDHKQPEVDEGVALCHEIEAVLSASTPLGRFMTEASFSETHTLVRLSLCGLAVPTAKAKTSLAAMLAAAQQNRDTPEPPSWEEIGRRHSQRQPT